jgi:hypothetical protein
LGGEEDEDEDAEVVPLALSQAADVALVRTKLTVAKFARLAAHEPSCGESVVACGFPHRGGIQHWETVTGELEQLDHQHPGEEWRDGVRLLKFKDAHIVGGFSGGPLLSREDGSVLGLVTTTRDDSKNIGGLAVPAAFLASAYGAIDEAQRSITWSLDESLLATVTGSLPFARHTQVPRVIAPVLVAMGRRPSERDQPLRLGVLAEQRSAPREPSELFEHDVWRESVRQHGVEYVDKREDQVLQDILAEVVVPGGSRLWVIQGEPGSGKSTLLRRWADQLASGHGGGLSDGLLLPVLVPFRAFSEDAAKLTGSHLAESLWACASRDVDRFPQLYAERRRFRFTPLWMLDGWDEAASLQLWTETFLERVCALPGFVIITCRTAILARDRAKVNLDRFLDVRSSYTIRDLDFPERERLVIARMHEFPEAAARLAKRLRSHTQLRALGGSPQLLSLMVAAACRDLREGRDPELPASRAEFYSRAIADSWDKKLAGARVSDELVLLREEVLTALARQLGLGDRLSISTADFATLLRERGLADADSRQEFRDKLVRAGILRSVEGHYEFVHLTFHEYYLMKALKAHDPKRVLRQHWTDPRYREVLALLVSDMAGSGGDVDDALDWLVSWGQSRAFWRKRQLSTIRQSPLRVVLSLIHRAGITLRPGSALLGRLISLIRVSPGRRLAVAWYPETPDVFLAALSQDPSVEIRQAVARNPNAPEASLVTLAADAEVRVRAAVARNAYTPESLLAALARDTDAEVRAAVARNPSTPEPLLVALAEDGDALGVRAAITDNPNAPDGVLLELARDEASWVRFLVALNPDAPPEALMLLTRDPSDQVREYLPVNPNLPAAGLAELTQDANPEVRAFAVAACVRPNTPRGLLDQLASDADPGVRAVVARQPSLPEPLLEVLANDPEPEVRAGVAQNPRTPLPLLTRLAEDATQEVRTRLSWRSLPEAVQLRLGRDRSPSVRALIVSSSANRRSTPKLLLDELAGDADPGVRRAMAAHPNTPEALLSELARHPDMKAAVAGNPSAPESLLLQLARDPDPLVRRQVVHNPQAPQMALVTISRVRDVGVAEREVPPAVAALTSPRLVLELV